MSRAKVDPGRGSDAGPRRVGDRRLRLNINWEASEFEFGSDVINILPSELLV